MANLPAVVEESSELTPRDRWRLAVAEQLALGKTPRQIANQMEGDRARRYRLTRKISRVASELAGREAIAAAMKTEMWLNMGVVTQALLRRAARGRPDAIKLVYEVTGFHNPKVQHEHSGELKVKVEMPRPPRRVDAEATAEPVDAEVVD